MMGLVRRPQCDVTNSVNRRQPGPDLPALGTLQLINVATCPSFSAARSGDKRSGARLDKEIRTNVPYLDQETGKPEQQSTNCVHPTGAREQQTFAALLTQS
jgi:hypothetical protein